MARILAIEPDVECGQALKRLIPTWVDADLRVVESAGAALAAVAEYCPDVILISELTSQADDVQFTSRLKDLPAARDLPILSVPPMVDRHVAPPQWRRGPLALISRRPALPWPAYDADAQAARLRAALRQSREAGVDRQQLTQELLASGVQASPGPHATTPGGRSSDPPAHPLTGRGNLAVSPIAVIGSDPSESPARHARAPRWKGANIPWLTRVTMPLGLEVRLVNVSRSGLLIESRSPFVLGQPTSFELAGAGRQVRATGRFVRIRPVTTPAGETRHHAAAVFDREVRLFSALSAPPVEPAGHTDTANTPLAAVMAWVRHEARTGLAAGRIRAAFELSIQELTGARDVRLCEIPVEVEGPGESFCFPVPVPDATGVFLQAVYDPGRHPARAVFDLFTAAAGLAADVLQIEAASY